MTDTVYMPPMRGDAPAPPAPPSTRAANDWGVLAAPRERSAFEVFGPPIAPPAPPVFSIAREQIAGVASPARPSVIFAELPVDNPSARLGTVAELARAMISGAGGLAAIDVMTAAMFQFLAESHKQQFAEHGGRLKNGAAVNLRVAAQLAKEIATLQKTQKVDINLRGDNQSHEAALRNLMSLPSLNA